MAGKKSKTKKTKDKKRAQRGLPSKEAILQYISENPGKIGKREIGRAFNIKGAAKIDLKAILKEMADEGLLQKRGKRLSQAGELPPVLVLDIVTRDREGGLLAIPADFDDKKGKPPLIFIKSKSKVVAGIGSRVLARVGRNKGENNSYIGSVIKVLEKKKDALLGILRLDGDEPRIEPIAKRQEELIIAIEHLNGAKAGDLVEVEPFQSKRRSLGVPRGKIVNVIGSITSEKAISMIAIYALGIPHKFPESVESAAREAKPISAKSTFHEDWRSVPLITIDPADAKDHDDAIFAETDPESDGGHIVTVAIADVSYYVRPKDPMDQEALLRGNSTYFPDRVVPMLPERISNDLCSLRENEDRPSLAVRMWFDEYGRKIKHKFHRVLMRSHFKLSYQEAQAAIDGKPNAKSKKALDTILKPLWAAYACMLKGRNAREPLELDLPERKIKLKPDGSVDRVLVPERLDAHKLVEEFMIQANVCAGETLEAKQQKLIYRIHDKPKDDRLEGLTEFLKSLSLPAVRPGNLRAGQFNGVLGAVKGSDNEELVNQVVLRSQSAAEYSPDNIGHFGLNLQKYAHFTSPIRRYADLIVHRALVTALGLGEGGLTRQEEEMLDVIAADISITERRSILAERETIDRLIATHLSEQIGEHFSGVINGVTKSGLFVTLSDTGADGFIPISKLGDEYYVYDRVTHSLIGEDSKNTYQMGMEVEVRLVEAAPVAGALRFDMISEGKKGSALPRSRQTNKKPGGASYRKFGKRRKRTSKR